MQTELSLNIEGIAACTDPQLLITELRNGLEITVGHILRMAAIVKRLEELGVEITIQIASLPFLRKIAYGQMDASLFVAFHGDDVLLKRVATLPMPDQERVARNEALKVMEPNGDHRMVPPLSMTRTEIKQVFGSGFIRGEAQQIGWIREKNERERSKVIPTVESVTVNRKRGGIEIGGVFLSRREMARLLTELG